MRGAPLELEPAEDGPQDNGTERLEREGEGGSRAQHSACPPFDARRGCQRYNDISLLCCPASALAGGPESRSV